MPYLLTRLGKRLCRLESLDIAYPVGRAGTRFEALMPRAIAAGLDTDKLRFFVVQDEGANRYPAIVDAVSLVEGRDDLTRIAGVVVANGS